MNCLSSPIKKISVLFCIINLAACSSMPSLQSHEYDFFTPLETNKRIIDVATVTWQIEDNASELCRKIMLRGKNKDDSDWAFINPPLACAVWYSSKKTCTIITSKLVSHTVLGHELRHCFEGHFHDHPTEPPAKTASRQ